MTLGHKEALIVTQAIDQTRLSVRRERRYPSRVKMCCADIR